MMNEFKLERKQIVFDVNAKSDFIGKDGFAHLTNKSYSNIIKEHNSEWLNNIKGLKCEVGKLEFNENGITFAGTYAMYAKEWNAEMTKPIKKHISGPHILYGIPTTYWDNNRTDISAVVAQSFINAYEG